MVSVAFFVPSGQKFEPAEILQFFSNFASIGSEQKLSIFPNYAYPIVHLIFHLLAVIRENLPSG